MNNIKQKINNCPIILNLNIVCLFVCVCTVVLRVVCLHVCNTHLSLSLSLSQVKDDDQALSLGSLSVPLSLLLSCPDLVLDKWFQLEGASPASRIYVTVVLRVRSLPGTPHNTHSIYIRGLFHIPATQLTKNTNKQVR